VSEAQKHDSHNGDARMNWIADCRSVVSTLVDWSCEQGVHEGMDAFMVTMTPET